MAPLGQIRGTRGIIPPQVLGCLRAARAVRAIGIEVLG